MRSRRAGPPTLIHKLPLLTVSFRDLPPEYRCPEKCLNPVMFKAENYMLAERRGAQPPPGAIPPPQVGSTARSRSARGPTPGRRRQGGSRHFDGRAVEKRPNRGRHHRRVLHPSPLAVEA